MLRAALETLGGGYVIVDVPSAEEAQLEFRRGPVDLLITDLRLPGISGLELIRRLHKASSEARMIVISAYADETAQAEFRHLGATFFPKPLDLPAFLNGVREAVSVREEARGREPVIPAVSHPDGGLPDIAARLARLQRDLSALSAFLMDADGRLVRQAGEASQLDLEALLPRLVEAFRASLRVSQALGGQAPANVQFFYGSAHDVYSVNVGAFFTLVIVFDGQHGAGQMGPVLRYGRLAADDLLNALRKLGVQAGPLPPTPTAQPARKPKTCPLQKKKKTGPLAPAAAIPESSPSAFATTAPLPPLAAGAETVPSARALSPEALQALEMAAAKTNSQDASKFWEDVDDAEIGDARTGTLTWEEAAKLGLVPPKATGEK